MSIWSCLMIQKLKQSNFQSTKVDVLPDIVGYLQNETQLTRKSIVISLRGTRISKVFQDQLEVY